MWREENPIKAKERSRISREKNRDKILQRKKNDYLKNRERILAEQKIYILQNGEEFRAKRREQRLRHLTYRREYDKLYHRKRRANNLTAKVLGNLRNRIRSAVKTKSNSTIVLLGCDIEFFIKHLENQFTPEMSWENYGKYWSIDHIKACQTFNMESEEEQRKCFNWSNCRPLSISENSIKGQTVDKRSKFIQNDSVLGSK